MTDTTTETTKHQKSRRRGRTLNIVLFILLLVALGAGGFWFYQYRQSLAKNPEVQQQRWAAELASVAILPSEKPLITTVLDKTKLTNKTLERQAENGDRLYIFSKAKQLILYRPSEKKVVTILTIQPK